MQRFPLSAIRLELQLRAPLVFAIGMMIGTIWYFSINFEPSMTGLLVLAGSGFSILIWAMRRTTPSVVIAGLMLLSGSVSGALSGSFATLRADHAAVQQPLGPVLVEGWITQAQPARRGVRLVLRVHSIDGLDAAQTPRTVRVTHISSLKTEPGRFVRCWAVLRPPPAPVIAGDYDFARQAWYAGLGAVGYVQGRCRGGVLGRPSAIVERVRLRISEGRRNLAMHVESASGDRAGGFAAALASGDRSFMQTADQEALRGSGLAHLLAISGLHMGIVGGLVFLIGWRTLSLIEPVALRWSVKKPAAGLALIACASYLIISGASVSTQRAFIMAAIIFGAVLLDRAALSLRSLSIAMIAVLILAPWSVLTPGFQMSFAATGALIATYEAWQKRLRDTPGTRRRGISFWLKSLFVTSAVSSLATMPFAMYHFGRVAGLGLLANLAAMPIVSLVSAPFAAAALLLAPLGLDGWALRGFGLSLEWILTIAHYFAGFGAERPSAFPPMPALSLAGFSAAIISYCLLDRMKSRAISLFCFAALSIAVWLSSATDRIHWAPSGELFLEYSSGAVQRLAIIEGDGLAPLRFVDTLIDHRCQPGLVCEMDFETDTITYLDPDLNGQVPGPETTVVLSRQTALQPSTISGAEIIQWSDVVRENGVTLERRNRGWIKQDKPMCGHRPWRPCPID